MSHPDPSPTVPSVQNRCRPSALGVTPVIVTPALEDPAECRSKEGNLPENVTPQNSALKDPEERSRIARVFARGLTEPSGFILPISSVLVGWCWWPAPSW